MDRLIQTKNPQTQGVPLQIGTTPTFDWTLRCKPMIQILHLIAELFFHFWASIQCKDRLVES